MQHVRLFNLLAYENVTDLPERTPVLGRVLGFGIMVVVIWIFWRIRPSRVDRWFRRLQLVLAAPYSLGHGTNDAQKTMGIRLTKLRLVGGFYSETAGAVMLVGTVIAGIPVSTTHAITSTISGVGAISCLSAVRWGVARQIVWAWILSIPLSAVIAAASFALIKLYLLF